MGESTGGFITVFEQRVTQLRKRLKDELEKKKNDRCKKTLKKTIREIKNWEKIVKENKKTNCCPHCGGKL